MDCLPLGTSGSADDDKIEDCDADPNKSSDINMESCTNPPTPASGMQVSFVRVRILQGSLYLAFE